MDYELIDSGNGKKLERFGKYTLCRPAAQAVWEPQKGAEVWASEDASFSREGKSGWKLSRGMPEQWKMTHAGVSFMLKLTDFGHIGIFPEHAAFWPWMQESIQKAGREVSVLNLFAYSGGATLAAAKAGASVCHVDASKGMTTWARENAAINRLEEAPIRWIVDDAIAFMKREVKRGNRYDAIVCDPPSFGRGAKGQVFKIEEEINSLIALCRSLLTETPLFILLSCHTPGFSPIVMKNLMSLEGGEVDAGEMVLTGSHGTYDMPCGTFGRWTAC